MKLLLFDIDGTLLKPIYSGRRHIEYVLTELCERSISTEGVAFSGRTDPQIFEDTLRRAGLSPREINDLIPVAIKKYTEHATYVPEEVDMSDGVAELLAYLRHQKQVQLALLTGNIRVTAYRKLAAVQLDHLFPFGAFGCDHADRNQLPAIAAHRAVEHCGKTFTGKDIVIIGDSVHDVTCGRELGVLSVAVATGFTSCLDLKAENPDVLLQDLTNIDDFLTSVGISFDDVHYL